MGMVTFYIVAHQDDWQLFRGEQAFVDLTLNNPVVGVVIICVTAGELGGPWPERENGCVASCRAALGDDACETSDVLDVNGHRVARVRYKNSVCYFLRIPEAGNTVGGPLQSLREQGQPTTTVDGANTYESWSDLTDTLRAIMEVERTVWDEPHPWFNAHDYAQQMGGPDDDNPDHIMVGFAVRDAALNNYDKLYFRGYRPPPPWEPGDPEPPSTDAPLSVEQVKNKRTLFMAYVNVDSALQADYQNSHDVYESWLSRTYFRVE